MSEHIEHNETVIFGFWLYLMTDLLMFAVLFAAYAVFEWLITLGALFAGAHGLGLTAAAASLAVLFVGVPFALSARARRQRANS